MKAAYARMCEHEVKAQNLRAQAWRQVDTFIQDGGHECIDRFQQLRAQADVKDAEALGAWRDLNDCHDDAVLHSLQSGECTYWWNEFM